MKEGIEAVKATLRANAMKMPPLPRSVESELTAENISILSPYI